MLSFILNLKAPQEVLLLLLLAFILFVAGKWNWLPEKMYKRELPLTLVVGAIGILIPTGISTALIILYVCWRIFSSATYELCPSCWQRLRRYWQK